MSRILNFKDNPVEILTLPELKLSVDETATNGRPFNGITHYDLFEELGNIATRHNEKFEYENLYVTDSTNKVMPGVACFPHLEEQYGKNALQASLLRRVVGSIGFSNYDDGDTNCRLAVNFHQKGIEICYGMNVRVCSNLSIFGGTHIMSYGNEGMPLQQMFQVYENWVQKLGDFRNNDLFMMEQMKSTFLPPGDSYKTLIGKLSVLAVQQAYIDSKTVSPMNIAQHSAFTKAFLKEYGPSPEEAVNVWELYNIVTNLLKPGTMNSEVILKQSTAAGKFFVDEYMEPINY